LTRSLWTKSPVDPAIQAKVEALSQKDVGQPVTLELQTKRTIDSIALVLGNKGEYSLVVSYQETQADADGNQIGLRISTATTIADADISSEVKSAIDIIYAATIAAI
jgi:hypothetical protein